MLLIRDPREVVASYVKSRATVTADDIGLPQQSGAVRRTLRDRVRRHRSWTPAISCARRNRTCALCGWLDIPYTARMLHWPKGPRASDGIWAPHWYAHVWESTGFEARVEKEVTLPGAAAEVAEECRPHFERLHGFRMRVGRPA